MAVKRALISVSDKTGLVEFAQKLASAGVEIVSTGGTAKVMEEAGIAVKMIDDLTGFPEMMNGRVKTLHPKVHGGLLARRDNEEHMAQAAENGVEMIDMVVVNLYPFEETVAKEGVTEEEAIENIDIGGPSMLRSAAKNFKDVVVVVDPSDYEAVGDAVANGDGVDLEMRKKLARKVFTRTSVYDEAINQYMRSVLDEPELLDLHYEKVCSLRYGENPQQKAAFFRNPENNDSNITNAEVLHGKQLSFNNLVDGNSALELVKEFQRPTAVFIKHNNPCGAASGETIEEAFVAGHGVDPMSAFGCIIAVNREVTEAVANYLFEKKMFVEMIIAPSYEEGALKRLMEKKNLRILRTGELKLDMMSTDIKKVAGGILIQTKDRYELTPEDLKVVTKKSPTEAEIASLLFANKVCKHVMSNAVVMAKGEVVAAIGAGQMSRVDSVRIAGFKGGERNQGAVMASDAFFPFADAMEQAVELGVGCILQPGGSINDDKVIARADELGISMVFSGRRYFRH
jgi:phosphoribosylaminoimidazolecarboxamide formyltransferase / IMP cyclohydrolase